MPGASQEGAGWALRRGRSDSGDERCEKRYLNHHTICKAVTRVTVRLPDDLGEDVKRRTDNVSEYVTEALTEKIRREERRRAHRELLGMAGEGSVDAFLHEKNQQLRRAEDRFGDVSPEEVPRG